MHDILKKLGRLLPLLTLAGVLASCNNSIESNKGQIVDGDLIHVSGSLNVAEQGGADTRALTENPDYSDLKLYIIEFEYDENSAVEKSGMTKNYGAIEGSVAEDGDFHFNVDLVKTTEPRVLHLIAVPKNTTLDINYGLEGDVISSLTVGGKTPAYWRRVPFPTGYGTVNASGDFVQNDDLESKLTHVGMIRNFSKISLSVTDQSKYELTGFAVINQPSEGYVAPYNTATNTFPEFVDGMTTLPFETINSEYKGVSPGFNATDQNAMTATYDKNPKYIYERPHFSINNPVVILQLKKRSDNSPQYYKLDLGYLNKADNLFEFYDILRNFEYAVTISSVGSDGYSTPQEALDGIVFNNFSMDINTRQLLNLSNGKEMLRINKNTFVVTNANQTTITFKYCFKTGVNTTGGGTVRNDRIKFKYLDTKGANNPIIYIDEGTSDDAGWRTVTLITKTPTAERLEHSFIAYDPVSGLGRTISVIVRVPWNYTDAGLWGGNYDTPKQFNARAEDGTLLRDPWKEYVSSDGIGQPLTIRFQIGSGIPEAMFPLKFVFEANPQNLENNKIGNLLVQTGPSFFNSNNTIKYVKTVSWVDYNTELTDDNFTGTIVRDEAGNKIHVVRARFLTITTILTYTTENPTDWNYVRVYNEYFRVKDSGSDYLELRYRGKAGKAPFTDGN